MHQHVKLLLSLALGVLLAAACSERKSDEMVVSSQRTRVFHSPNCEWAGKISGSNKRNFTNAQAALAAGLRPCEVCRNQIPGLPASKGDTDPPVRKFDSLN